MTEGPMQCIDKGDRQESSLETLERRSNEVLGNIRMAKVRISGLLNKIRKVDDCNDKCLSEAETGADNRIGQVVITIDKIDNEGHEFNKILAELEGILE